MTDSFTGPPTVRLELNRVMQALAAGVPADEVESEPVDRAEEPGRRDRSGQTLSGGSTNEAAATYVAEELACLANSGGGAIVLGVADTGYIVGTALDVDWLRHRIYELTDGSSPCRQPHSSYRARLLELGAPSALEPIRFRGKIRHRVGKHCVEIDAATWAG